MPPNMQLKSWLRHSDVATCHANRIAISAPERLRRLTGCYVALWIASEIEETR
jgi:hypothetical protein